MMSKVLGIYDQLLASRVNPLNIVLDAQKRLDLQDGPLLLVFWGSRGCGKTTFLRETQKRLSLDPNIEIAGFWDLESQEASDLPERILEAVRSRTSKHKAIFIDNLDRLLKDSTGREFFGFEQEAILPLIERGDTLIIAGSQVGLNQWQEYDVRDREESYQLGPLSLDEVREMLKTTKIDPETCYELTFGQPRVLDEYLSNPDWTEKEIARFAAEYFLEDLPDETREITQTVSLLPAFNIYILRKVRGDEKKDDEDLLSKYNDQINELTSRWIVQFDIDTGDYRFTDNAIRRLLALNLLKTRPKQFDQIQRIAAEYFQEEAKSASYLPQLIVSSIYHQAQANRTLSEAKRGLLCVNWIKEMRNFWNGARWEQVLEMWETGAGSPELRDEITSLIGEKYHKKIAEMFLQYKKEMEP